MMEMMIQVLSMAVTCHLISANRITHNGALHGSDRRSTKRQVEVDKPQVYSGPFPCMDKDGAPQLPPYLGGPAFWFTDDQCHQSYCPGPMVLTKSLGCFLKGAACPPGSYLDVPAKPNSPADCCLCKPMESLRKRDSTKVKPLFDPVLQKRARYLVHRLEREFWETARRATNRKLLAKHKRR